MRLREMLLQNRVPMVLLLLIVVIGGSLRFAHAANPQEASADERSYIALAKGFSETSKFGDYHSTKIKNPRHWSPGAPLFFGLVDKVFPVDASPKWNGLPAAYFAQAAISTLTILLVFGIVALLAGPWAGVVASALISFHVSLIQVCNHLLSETFGMFMLVSMTFLLLLVWKKRAWWFIFPGIFLAGAILARADLLPTLPVLALGLVIFRWRVGRKQAAFSAAALTVGALLILAPWSIKQSQHEGAFVPVTNGSGASLFVGTFLPGDGSSERTKRYFAKKIKPKSDDATKPRKIISGYQLTIIIGRRHPELSRDKALQKEGIRNIKRYALRQPVAFTEMMVKKAGRTWLRPTMPGDWAPPIWFRRLHGLVAILSLLGAIAGFVATRERRILAVMTPVAVGTLLHMIVVTNPRYALPMYPLLVSAGVAGWFMFIAKRRGGRVSGQLPAEAS